MASQTSTSRHFAAIYLVLVLASSFQSGRAFYLEGVCESPSSKYLADGAFKLLERHIGPASCFPSLHHLNQGLHAWLHSSSAKARELKFGCAAAGGWAFANPFFGLPALVDQFGKMYFVFEASRPRAGT